MMKLVWALLPSALVAATPQRDALMSDAELAAAGDEVCEGDEAECALHLRQLRGEVLTAAVHGHEHRASQAPGEEEEPSPEEEVPDEAPEAEGEEDEAEEEPADEVDLFIDSDKNRDGELQHDELVGFLGEGRTQEETLQLLQLHDADQSGGLSVEEFTTGLEAWGAGCGTRRVASFCVGAVRHCCCARGAVWSSCGCRGHVATCGGGYHAGASYHKSGPYGSSGGAYRYHKGPYGGVSGGGVHYHKGPYGGGGGAYHYRTYR